MGLVGAGERPCIVPPMTRTFAIGSISSPIRRRPGAGRLICAALALGLTLALPACKSVSDDSIRQVGLSEAQRPFQKGDDSVLFIDPRPAEDYAAGHIPGAVNLRLPDVDLNDPDPALNRYKLLIVYGDNPGSSTARGMVKKLLTAEYKHVRLFSAGLDSWKAAGMPVSTGGATP